MNVDTYPVKHSGPVLVCGPAECLWDDVKATGLLERAPRMAVNSAAGMIAAQFVASVHWELMDGFRRLQTEWHRDFTTHATWSPEIKDEFPAVDYFWRDTISPASSAWGAANIARRMGFDPVILCGCPLDGSGYFRAIGDKRVQNPTPVRRFQIELADIVGRGHGKGVYSMSGYTRELLGAPHGE